MILFSTILYLLRPGGFKLARIEVVLEILGLTFVELLPGLAITLGADFQVAKPKDLFQNFLKLVQDNLEKNRVLIDY